MDDAVLPAPRVWPAAVLVGASSALLGAITLGSKSLWFDEAFNGVRVRQSWGNVIRMIGDTEMSQALYMLLLKPWSTAYPYSEAWLRFPSVVVAALAAALLVLLGARLFDRTTGILAGILLATNEMLVSWSQQVRTYALVTLAVVLASLLFVRALDDPRRRNWLLYALAAALAVYCHFFAGFVIVAHLASLPFAPTRPPLGRVIEAAVAFVAAISVALYFTATAGRGQLTWISEPSLELVRRVAERTSGENVVLLVAVVAGLVLLARQARQHVPAARWRLALIGGWIALPIGLALIVSFFQPILVTRYAIVITPALALAGAIAVRRLWGIRVWVGMLGLGAILAVSGIRISDWYGKNPEDWRGATAYVARVRAAQDDVIVAPAWALEGFRFYDGSTTVSYRPVTRRTVMVIRAARPDDVAEAMRDATGPGRFRVVEARRFGRQLQVRVVEPAP